jgi:hypothetical protein
MWDETNVESLQCYPESSANLFVCQVIQCTEEMTKQTLWDAMHTEQPNVEAVKVIIFANT